MDCSLNSKPYSDIFSILSFFIYCGVVDLCGLVSCVVPEEKFMVVVISKDQYLLSKRPFLYFLHLIWIPILVLDSVPNLFLTRIHSFKILFMFALHYFALYNPMPSCKSSLICSSFLFTSSTCEKE